VFKLVLWLTNSQGNNAQRVNMHFARLNFYSISPPTLTINNYTLPIINYTLSSPTFSIQTPVLNGFGQMFGFYIGTVAKVGNGAANF